MGSKAPGFGLWSFAACGKTPKTPISGVNYAILNSVSAKTLFQNGRNAITREQRSVSSAAVVLMTTILASRFLGLLRDRTLTTFLHVDKLGVYFAAFRLPDTVFQLVVWGALSSAFIPVFCSMLDKEKSSVSEKAANLANVCITVGTAVFLTLGAVIFIFAHPLSALIAPGFTTAQTHLMANLTRIMLAAQLFFVFSNFLTSILESLRRFVIPAVAPLLYNLGIIICTILLSGKIGIYAPAVGVVAGAFLHLIIQIPLAYSLGLKLKPSFNIDLPGVKTVGKLMVPRTIGLAASQIAHTADILLASLISASAVAYLNFANHLQLIPVGLFGLAIGKASLPNLSRYANKKDRAGFEKTLLYSLEMLIFLTMPAAASLLILRIPAVRLAFGADRFNWKSTVLTGYTLAFYALSIPAQSISHILRRSFYALHNTRTPVIISITSIIFNIILSLLFIFFFELPIWGLALSFSLGSIFNAAALLWRINNELPTFNWKNFLIFSFKTVLATITSAGVMYILLKILDRSAWDKNLSFLGFFTLPERFEYYILDTRYTKNLILLTLLVGVIGAAVYTLTAWLLKIRMLKEIPAIYKKLKKGIIVKTEPSNNPC